MPETDRLPYRLLFALSALVFGVGLLVAVATPGPLLHLDDIANFGLSYTLAGQGSVPMAPQAPYGLLYPAALAPGWLLGLDSAAMLLWARILNALFGAALVPVLFILLRRLTSVTTTVALAAATVGAMYPVGLSTGSIAWPERLMMLLVPLAVLAVTMVAQSPQRRFVPLGCLVAVALYAAHPRLGLAGLVMIVIVALYARKHGWLVAASALFGGVAGLVVVEAARSRVATAAFGDSGSYDVGVIAERRSVDQIPQMLAHGLGAGAYLVLATTVIGVWGACQLLRGEQRWTFVALSVSIFGVAAWFLPGIERADKWLHGRYVEVLAPLMLAFGLATLNELRTRRDLAVVAVAFVVAVVVAVMNGPAGVWEDVGRSPVMMLGVEFGGAPYGNATFQPWLAVGVSALASLVVWFTARTQPVVTAAVVAAGLSLWAAHSGDAMLDVLADGSSAGELAAFDLSGETIEELHVDPYVVSGNLTNGLAFAVGFDRSVLTASPQTTHAVLPPGFDGPAGSVLVAEFQLGSLWRLAG